MHDAMERCGMPSLVLVWATVTRIHGRVKTGDDFRDEIDRRPYCGSGNRNTFRRVEVLAMD